MPVRRRQPRVGLATGGERQNSKTWSAASRRIDRSHYSSKCIELTREGKRSVLFKVGQVLTASNGSFGTIAENGQMESECSLLPVITFGARNDFRRICGTLEVNSV